MEMVTEMIGQLILFLENWKDNSDTYWERILVWIMIAYLEIKIMLLEFVSGIAETIVINSGISDALLGAWGGVSGDTLAVFSYLGIPDALNMILSAVITRFILDMLP